MSGPAPGSRCGVCRHQDAPLINHAWAGGASGRGLAEKYGLGKDSVLRHFAARHPGVPERNIDPSGVPGRPGAPLGTTRDQLEEIRDALRARVLAGQARTDEMRELRLTVDALAKMSGEDRPKSVSFRDVVGMDRFLNVLASELEPFPEVRQRLQKRLEEEVPELFGDPAPPEPEEEADAEA